MFYCMEIFNLNIIQATSPSCVILHVSFQVCSNCMAVTLYRSWCATSAQTALYYFSFFSVEMLTTLSIPHTNYENAIAHGIPKEQTLKIWLDCLLVTKTVNMPSDCLELVHVRRTHNYTVIISLIV